MPEVIYSPGKLQTRLLLFFSDVLQEIVDSDNEKFEDVSLFIKKDCILHLTCVLRRLVDHYRHGYLVDDFVRLVYDQKLIAA